MLLVLYPVLALAAIAPVKRTPPPPPAAHVVQQGRLLVAGRSMQDPRFRRTVILVLRHGREGTLGLVINRATAVTLSHALPDLKYAGKRQHLMYYGGPVLPERLWVLFRHAAPPETAEHVQADIHFAGLQATLEALLEGAAPHLAAHGLLALEVDCTRAEAAAALARRAGWCGVRLEPDVFGRLRYLLTTRELER